jgi:hypothetical protein
VEVFPYNVKKTDKNLGVSEIMLTFGTSNVSNCEEREISFPFINTIIKKQEAAPL